MPRIAQTELTHRAPSETQNTLPSVQQGVYSRIMGSQASARNTGAGQLARALNIAMPGVETAVSKYHQDQKALGANAAESGNFDTTGKSDSYVEGVQRIQALNAGAHAQAQVSQYLNSLDPTTPMDVAMKHVDDIFHATMGDAAGTPDQARALLPIATKLRAAAIEQVAAKHQQYVQQLTLNDATDTLHKEFATTGTIDTATVQKLHDAMLQAGVSPSDWNKWLITSVGTIAQEHGDKPLMDKVLGASYGSLNGKPLPPPNAVTALQDQISKYEYYATAQSRYNDKAAQEALKEQQKQLTSKTESTLMQALVSHQNGMPIVESYLKNGGDGAQAYKMIGWIHDANEKITSGHYDPGAYANLDARIYTGDADQGDILNAYTSGQLGTGDDAVKRMNTLMSKLHTHRTQVNENPVYKSVDYRFFAGKVKDMWKPPHIGSFQPSQNDVLRQQTAMELFNQYVGEGMKSPEAFAKVQKEVPLATDNGANMSTSDAQTLHNAGYVFGPTEDQHYTRLVHVRNALQAVKAGTMSQTQFAQQFNAKDIKDMVDHHYIDEKDAREALVMILDHLHNQ